MASLFVLKALNTILGQNNTEVGIDPSAMYRINTINYVKDLFINNPLYFIFGNGYKFYYVDVPVLEVFLDFGIIGLILYLFYISFTYYFSFKNIFLSNDNFQIFVSIYIITGFLSLFTQGRPIDYTFFMHAAFYIRFLKIT